MRNFLYQWACILLAAAVWMAGMPILSAAAESETKIEWRPLHKRSEAYMGADKADFPQYYQKGKYGGEGMQYIQGAAVHADGTVLMGQDMGSARISEDFGLTWYTPPNAGNPLIGGNSCAIDPADSDVMFIEMSAKTMGVTYPKLRELEGIYRSEDKGQSWTLVQTVPNLGNTGAYRCYRDDFACYPTAGGDVGSRLWRYAVSDQDGGDGGFWSSEGGTEWKRVSVMPANTFGVMYALVQHPTVRDTLYLCSATGLWQTVDGGVTWSEPWADTLTGTARSLWIDPDEASHMIVSIYGGQHGVRETDDNGSSWNCILSDILPGQLSVGAKDDAGRRMIYVHTPDNKGTPRIRTFDGEWITPQTQPTDPTKWAQSSLTGANQCVFLPHPTIPDLCIAHGKSFWWRSENRKGKLWTDSSTNYFGTGFSQIAFDETDWKKFYVVCPDSGTCMTQNGGDWFTESNITAKEPGGQWARMVAVTSESAVSYRHGISNAVLPDPWPTDAPRPANEKVPGRRILTLGGNATHFIFTQDVGQNDWSDLIEQDVSTGGGGTERNYVFYSRQNPNIVYAGPNVSTDGATTWSMTTDGLEICAMSYLDGDLVYAVANNREIMRSFDRGQTWESIFKASWRLTSTRGAGYVYADPFSDERLYIKSPAGDVMLLYPTEKGWKGTDYKLRDQFDKVPVGFDISQICPDPNMEGLIYALINISGYPNIWRGRVSEDFRTCQWEDITQNAPRIAQSGSLSIHPVTGDVIYGSGNGNFVYPAPDDWQHRNPEMRQYKRALWNNMPLPIPNGATHHSDIPPNPDQKDRVMVNGKILDNLDVEPRRVNDRLLVPMRAIFEALGAEVFWDEATETVTGVRNGTTVVLKIGSSSATVNGREISIDTEPVIENGRTLVPVRFVAESLGAAVNWDEESKTAVIQID